MRKRRLNEDKLAALNEEAAALGYGNVIHFGPRVQQEIEGQVITTGITEQVAELILEDRRNTIVESMFIPYEQPILATPAAPKQNNKASVRTKVMKTVVGA